MLLIVYINPVTLNNMEENKKCKDISVKRIYEYVFGGYKILPNF